MWLKLFSPVNLKIFFLFSTFLRSNFKCLRRKGRASLLRKRDVQKKVIVKLILSDEDASQEVKTKFCEKENSVKKFLVGAVKKTQEIIGMGN